jgi:hypothetical protein
MNYYCLGSAVISSLAVLTRADGTSEERSGSAGGART